MRTRLILLVLLVLSRSLVCAHPLHFIDSSIENGSPIWYDFASNGVVQVHLLYDLERDSPNRAAGHIHFRVEADPGAYLTFEFLNLDNVWNSTPGSVAGELKTMVVSQDGHTWKSIPTETLPTNRIQLHFEMPGRFLYIARVEPYRLSDLDRFLNSIRANPLIQITPIGKTALGRELEIIRLGKTNAPYRVFLRARAHPWEPGGNWIIEGLVHHLLEPNSAPFLDRYSVYILPMANKDGVALGRTRFNMRGKDLNRNWDKLADPNLAPENAALEKWLQNMVLIRQKPHLALELHNDGNGKLHISRPPIPNLDRYLERMKILEELLRKDTWFTEGPTSGDFKNSGTLGEGWLQRYGIDAAVHEFNCNWIAGLKDYPSAAHWKTYGTNLATVFFEYFDRVKPQP